MSGLRTLDPLANPEWDQLVARHPDATIFHTSAWARVLAGTYGYEPFYSIGAGDPPALLCAFEVDSRITGCRGISLPFTDECAFLPSIACRSRAAFDFMRERGAARKWKTFETRGWNCGPPSLRFYKHVLNLRPGADALFAGVDGSVRRAIRKAERSGLSVAVESSLEAVRQYYQLHCITRRTHGLPPQPLRFFESIHRHVISHGGGFVMTATLNGKAIAAAFFLTFGRRAHYKFGASNPGFEMLRPNNLVMWAAIKHCIEIGLESLDFGRTSLHADGLRRYKLQWGAAESELACSKWDFRRSSFTQDVDRSSGIKNTVFRLLPLRVNRLLGRLLYPHIA